MLHSSISGKTALLLLAGILAGAASGWLFRAESGSASVSAAVIADRPPEPSQVIGRKRLLPQTEARLEALRNAGSPSRQVAVALAFGEIDSVEEIRDLLDHSRQFPSHSGEEVGIASLLSRWLELEPEGALDYCRTRQPDFLARLVGTWAGKDPEATMNWVQGRPAGDEQTRMWLELCKSAADRDPVKGWDILLNTPGLGSPNSSWVAESTLRRIAGKNLPEALARLETVPPALSGILRKAIATEWMKTDPAAAWDWVIQQPSSAEAAGAALSVALREDATMAFGMLKALPAEEFRRILDGGATNWTMKDPQAFAALLAGPTGMDSKNVSDLAGRVLNYSGYMNPEGAASLLPLIHLDNLQTSIRSLLQQMRNGDAAKADAWPDSLPPGEIRAIALAEADRARAAMESGADQRSPESLVATVMEGNYVDSGDIRITRLSVEQLGKIMTAPRGNNPGFGLEILPKLAATNPGTGAAWLETATLDRNSGKAAAQFSARWAAEDPAAAAAWVQRLPDGELGRVAGGNVALQYNRFDSAGARAWAESLPPGAAREAALKEIGGK